MKNQKKNFQLKLDDMKLRKHVYKSQNYHAQKKYKLEIENCQQIIEDNKNLIYNGSFTAKIHYDKMKAGQIKYFWKNLDNWCKLTLCRPKIYFGIQEAN